MSAWMYKLVAAALVGGAAVAGGGALLSEGPPQDPGPQAAAGPQRQSRRQDVGKVPGKASKAGKAEGPGRPDAGEAARVNALTLAFNNATGALRTQDGALHSIHQKDGAILYTREAPDGARTETRLATTGGQLPALASDGESLIATWSAGRPPRVYAAISADGGQSWGTAQEVSQGPGTTASARAWREGRSMRAALAWHDPFNERAPDGRAVSIHAATWDGRAWSAPQTLSDPAHRAAFVALGGRAGALKAVWRQEVSQGVWELVFAELGARGWSEPWKPGLTGWDPSFCEDPQGVLHLGYHHQRRAYAARSTDGGRSWSSPTQLGTGLFVHSACAPSGQVAMFFEELTSDGSMFDSSIKTFGLYISDDGGASYTRRPVQEGRTGLVRPTACYNPDGSLELLWVRDDGLTLALERDRVQP